MLEISEVEVGRWASESLERSYCPAGEETNNIFSFFSEVWKLCMKKKYKLNLKKFVGADLFYRASRSVGQNETNIFMN